MSTISMQYYHFIILLIINPLTVSAKKLLNQKSLQVVHQEQNTWLNLYQSKQQTLQVWHQKQNRQSMLEIASPAGGCRVQLNLQHVNEPQVKSTQEVSIKKVKGIIRHLKSNASLPLQQVKSVLTFSIDTDTSFQINNILSVGCPLNHQDKIKYKKVKTKRYKIALDPNQSFKHKLLQQLKHLSPNIQAHQIWKALEVASNTNHFWFYDDEFLVYFQPTSSEKVQINSLSKTITQKKQVYWSQASATKKLHLKVYVINFSKALTPLDRLFSQDFTQDVDSRLWKDLIRFLSYQEGIYAGLSEGLSQNSFAALPAMTFLMPLMSNQWLDVAVKQSIIHTQNFPNSYQTPLKEMDPRLFLTHVLSQYFLQHKDGKQKANSLLKTKHQQRFLASYLTPFLASLWRYAMHFAHKPAQKYLISIEAPQNILLPIDLTKAKKSQSKTAYPVNQLLDTIQRWKKSLPKVESVQTYLENVSLLPSSLYHSYRLVKQGQPSALIAPSTASSHRALKLAKKWNKSRPFFFRKLDINEARRRVEMWGNFFEDPDFYESFQHLNYDLNLPIYQLSNQSIDARVATDLLWGRGLNKIDLRAILNTMLHFPMGLLVPSGVIQHQDFIFKSDLKEYKDSVFKPKFTAWHQVVWNYALHHQRQRKWKSKDLLYIVYHQELLWKRLTEDPSRIDDFFNHHDREVGNIQLHQERLQSKASLTHPWSLLNASILTLKKPVPFNYDQPLPTNGL